MAVHPQIQEALKQLHAVEQKYWQEGASCAPALELAQKDLLALIEVDIERQVRERTPLPPHFDSGWSCWNCQRTSVLPLPTSEREAMLFRSAACSWCGAISEYYLLAEDEVVMAREWDKPTQEPFYTIPGLISYRDSPRLPDSATTKFFCGTAGCKQEFVHHVVIHHSEHEHEGRILCCRHTGEALRTIKGTHVDGPPALRCDQLPTCHPDDRMQCGAGMDCTTPAAHVTRDDEGAVALLCCKHTRSDLKDFPARFMSGSFGDCWGLSSCNDKGPS